MTRDIEFQLESDVLHEALVALASKWPVICQGCEDFLAANAVLEHRQPDRLRVHIHPETGRIFFVLDSPRHFYGLVATANVPALEARYYQLPEDEALFDRGYEALVEEVRDSVVATLPPESTESALRAFCMANSLHFTTVVADDLETEAVVKLAEWGRQR